MNRIQNMYSREYVLLRLGGEGGIIKVYQQQRSGLQHKQSTDCLDPPSMALLSIQNIKLM